MDSVPQVSSGSQLAEFASGELKSYAELNRHVLQTGQTAPYRLWLLLRSCDPAGSGLVGKRQLLAAMAECGLGGRILRRVVQDPNSSIFFSVDKHRVFYRSLESVCLALGVEPGRPVLLPLECVSGMEAFRAHLYASWFAALPRGCAMISRERLSQLFGVSEDTQRRWEACSGLVVDFNVVEVQSDDENAAESRIPRDNRLDDRLDQTYAWYYRGCLYYRTVNCYSAPEICRGAVGNTRRIGRVVRSVEPVDVHGDGTRRERVFFHRRVASSNYRIGDCIEATGYQCNPPQGRSGLLRFSRFRPAASREEAMA